MDQNLMDMKTRYVHNTTAHNLAAPSEVVPNIMELFKPTSVLDVGCGIGTWLKVFNGHGVEDFVGIDGEYVDRQLLEIPLSRFVTRDLETPFNLGRKFDLVICFEVAEHLKESVAVSFVHQLTEHGDIVLFSAAIPGQGGQNHLNEKWLSDWVKIFKAEGYSAYDVLRQPIWDNPKVDVWYKQNMICFCKNGHELESKLKMLSSKYIDLVHPDLFVFFTKQAERAHLFEQGKVGIRLSWQAFFKSVLEKFQR